MNSAMTITHLENNLVASLDSKKTAKLYRDKVINIKQKYNEKVKMVSQTVKQVVKPNYERVLNMFNISVYENNSEKTRPTGARKLKVNPIVRDSSRKMYDTCIKDGLAIKVPVSVSQVVKPEIEFSVNEPANNSVNNVVEFPSSRVQNLSSARSVETPVRQENNVREFAMSRANVQPVSPEPNLSNFSRVMRMDYNNNLAVNNQDSHVEEKVRRDNVVSIDDYLQHGSSTGDKDIAELLQTNEKLDSEIGRTQSILENLEAELKRIQIVREEKRKAQLNALEEERLSKTATLNGLTEQIRALQEAIRLEQQNLNETTSSYRRAG